MDSARLYQRVGHCCGTCLGPILWHTDGFLCGVCDAAGVRVEDICGCGISKNGGIKKLGFHCIENPVRGPASPAAVIIAFGELPITGPAGMVSQP